MVDNGGGYDNAIRDGLEKKIMEECNFITERFIIGTT